MKKSSLIVAFTLAVAMVGAAYADDPTIDNSQSVASTKTRSQVQDELVQARLDGSIKYWSIRYNPLALYKPVKTRNQVRDELEAAQASGELSAFTREDSGSAFLARAARPGVTATGVLAGTPARAQ